MGAHSAGADHIRQRLYWVADAKSGRIDGVLRNATGEGRTRNEGKQESGLGSEPCGLADMQGERCREARHSGGRPSKRAGVSGEPGGLADAQIMRSQGDGTGRKQEPSTHAGKRIPLCDCTGRNFWSNAVAIPCRDGTFRRAEPGIFPLVDGLPRGVVPSCDPCAPGYANETAEARVMRLKGYGNAINVETARMFIVAVTQARGR